MPKERVSAIVLAPVDDFCRNLILFWSARVASKPRQRGSGLDAVEPEFRMPVQRRLCRRYFALLSEVPFVD